MASYVPLTDTETERHMDELMGFGDKPEVNLGLRLYRDDMWLRSNISKLLNLFGAKGECQSCHEELYWMPRPGKGPIPYTKLGLVHFSQCRVASRPSTGGPDASEGN